MMKDKDCLVLRFMLLLVCFLFVGCVSAVKDESPVHATEESMPADVELTGQAVAATAEDFMSEPELPEFVPVMESSSPLHTRVVSVAARNTPLRDVLFTIAETAKLNLVLERGVEPELPITMNFKDIGVEDALDIIFDSVDYFYSVNGNILVVRAVDTEVFELGRPNIIQEYKVDIGGDILSGTSSGDDEANTVSGDVSIKSESDSTSFQFWDSVENNLATLLPSGSEDTGSASGSKFIVNRMTGTVMVTAAKRDLAVVRNYINNLKMILNRQVLVEARIVEVQLSEGLKYGIDWEAVGRWFNEGVVSVSATNFTDVFASGGSSFNVNILDADDFSFLLKALQEQGDVETLSNPRVNIMNGQTSLLSVGRNTTFISRVESNITTQDGSDITTFTVETNSVLSGLMFGLVPYINSNGEVTLTITPILSNLVELAPETIGQGTTNAVEIKLPTVDLREMSTTVKVLDGQLIVIGGLIDKKEVIREDKIPFIGDIPLIGSAFKSVEKTYENKELVIMIIPRIIS